MPHHRNVREVLALRPLSCREAAVRKVGAWEHGCQNSLPQAAMSPAPGMEVALLQGEQGSSGTLHHGWRWPCRLYMLMLGDQIALGACCTPTVSGCPLQLQHVLQSVLPLVRMLLPSLSPSWSQGMLQGGDGGCAFGASPHIPL